MLLAYVCGPYRDPTEFGVLNNIRTAEAIALKIWALGVACICPHKNTAFLGGSLPDRVWLEGDLEMIRRSDAVVCMSGWRNSLGACGEVELANQLGIPVFETFEEFEKWVRSLGQKGA